MSCSQCYTVQVPECIEKLYISARIPGDDYIDTVIKITDSHGNVYYVSAGANDNKITIDIANSSLPKNLFNRYAGTITLEVMNSVGVAATMTICDKEYTCITLDVINNNLSLPEYSIGCRS